MKKTIILLSVLLQAQVINNTFRVSYQDLDFGEKLGLVETSYLFNFKNFYSGIGIYSAVNGKRGGFFTGGIENGYKFNFNRFIWDNGVFIGAGGGGSAPQGSGFMVKLHSGILYKDRNTDYGININKIFFPDGGIDSTQLGFQIDYNFKDIYFFDTKITNGYYGVSNLEFKPFLINYFPFDSKNTANQNQNDFSVIGAKIVKKEENYYKFFEAGGALRGDSDGFAEYLFGIGKKYYVNLEASIGFAGGGKVNTKGGGVYKVGVSTDNKYINIESGYFASIENGFKSYYLGISLDKKFNFLTIGNKYIDNIKYQKFAIKIYNESYLSSSTIRKNKDSQRLDNLNIDIDYFINNNLYTLITAGAAYNGNSGGYAVGMVGIGYRYNNIFSKLSIGAGGGGNVDVGGGLIGKIEVGTEYKNIFASIGKIKAVKGNLDTYFIDFGYKFEFFKGEI